MLRDNCIYENISLLNITDSALSVPLLFLGLGGLNITLAMSEFTPSLEHYPKEGVNSDMTRAT